MSASSRPLDVARLLAWLGIKGRRRGSEWWACCPFHVEREPSWQMRDEPDAPEHGLWRCFGCGEKGNAVGLAAAVLGVERREAFSLLEAAGVLGAAPALPPRVEVVSLPVRAGFVMPAGVEYGPLTAWVTPARRFAERRRITPAQVDRWGLGYAVDGKLRGRIVLPIRDGRGRLVGYSARTFVDDEKRYLEASSAEGYDAGAVFGEQHWPEPGARGVLVVTEGGLNALAAERALDVCADFDRVVPSVGAVRGSNLQPGHVARLGTFRRIVVASDPDAAGEKLHRALRDALGRWVELARAVLPPKKDCNDVERELGLEALGALLARCAIR